MILSLKTRASKKPSLTYITLTKSSSDMNSTISVPLRDEEVSKLYDAIQDWLIATRTVGRK